MHRRCDFDNRNLKISWHDASQTRCHRLVCLSSDWGPAQDKVLVCLSRDWGPGEEEKIGNFDLVLLCGCELFVETFKKGGECSGSWSKLRMCRISKQYMLKMLLADECEHCHLFKREMMKDLD